MTNETRTLIELEDITGIDMGCPHCEIRLFHPMSRADTVPITCPSCNGQWFGGTVDQNNRTVGSEQVKTLAKVLKLLTAERGDIYVRLKLHVETLQKA